MCLWQCLFLLSDVEKSQNLLKKLRSDCDTVKGVSFLELPLKQFILILNLQSGLTGLKELCTLSLPDPSPYWGESCVPSVLVGIMVSQRGACHLLAFGLIISSSGVESKFYDITSFFFLGDCWELNVLYTLSDLGCSLTVIIWVYPGHCYACECTFVFPQVLWRVNTKMELDLLEVYWVKCLRRLKVKDQKKARILRLQCICHLWKEKRND